MEHRAFNETHLFITGCVSIIVLMLLAGCYPKPADQTGKAGLTADTTFARRLVQKPLGVTGYALSIPPSHSLSVAEGPDFVMYYLVPLDTARHNLFTAGIYLGNHPNVFGFDTTGFRVELLAGELLGKSTTWTLYQRDSTYFLQTIAHPLSTEEWIGAIHLFGSGPSRTEIAHLQTTFATLTRPQSGSQSR